MISARLRQRLFARELIKIINSSYEEKLTSCASLEEVSNFILSCQDDLLNKQGNLNIEWDLRDFNSSSLLSIASQLRPDLSKGKPLDTNGIVATLAAICKGLINTSAPVEFNEWQKWFHSESQLPNLLPPDIAERLPFGIDVQALVYSALFGKMPFSKNYVLKFYEWRHGPKEYLVFPSLNKSPKRLVVLFSGNVGRKTYNRYSWYWDESEEWNSETAYLFLNDVDSHWYVGKSGDQDRKLYSEIILSVGKNFAISKENIFTVGGSMGGYGALFYAIELHLGGAIAINPQLSFNSALRYKERSWEVKIRECGENFSEISDLIYRNRFAPFIYIEQSLNPADQAGTQDTIQALRMNSCTFILKTSADHEHLTTRPTKLQIERLVDFIADAQHLII